MPAWLDNLVPLKAPRLDEHQLAGRRPKAVAMRGLGCRLLADQRIPWTTASRYLPTSMCRSGPAATPAIVQFGAYSRELHTAGVPTGSNEIGAPRSSPIAAMRRWW